jgi:uncharacterized protein (DUF4415 family)
MKKKKTSINPDTALTNQELDTMGPWMHGIEGLPPEAQRAVKRFVGRPKIAQPKEQVTVRFDHEVINALRAKGRGWQTALNALVREAIVDKRI